MSAPGDQKDETDTVEEVHKEGDEATATKQSEKEIEQAQEAELRAKFPNVRGPGASALLQRRLSKGTKYFDSGDYNMAKAKTAPAPKLPTAPAGHKLLMPAMGVEPPTGSTIPTPETVPQRKASIQQSKLVTAS